MPLHALNHFTITPVDLEATKDFYSDVLGLEVGYRPPLNFPGYWLYSAGTATVHLIGFRAGDKPAARKETKTGRFDHVAFACTGLKQMKARLKKLDITYEERVLPRDRQTQLFLRDPDGIAVELNFPSHETPAAAA
jgi:catechol 2,3-dioxygenase-like lactoylglutathione lyase family enzyme